MTDNRTQPIKTAAVCVEPQQHRYAWDLQADNAVYPVTVTAGAKAYTVFACMKQPYDANGLIAAINQARGSFRRSDTTIDNIAGDRGSYANYCDQVFLRFYGTSSDNPEEHKRYLAANFMLRIRLVIEGMGGIMVDKSAVAIPEPEKASDSDLLPLALDMVSDIYIGLKQELWTGETPTKTVDIKMLHVFRPETEKDWRKWQRTSAEQMDRVKGTQTTVINWWQRVELYDAMIQRVEGMVIDGAPCVESNREQWVKLVPAWHKFLAIGEVFEEARVKN